MQCEFDTPIQSMIDLYKNIRERGYEIWIMTGRTESTRSITAKSLSDNGIDYDYMLMRKDGVKIPDHYLKPSWIPKNNLEERVVAIFDDRDKVIEAFIKKGYNTIDVKPIINETILFDIDRELPNINKKKKKLTF